MLNDINHNLRRGVDHRRKLFPRFSPTAIWTEPLGEGPVATPPPAPPTRDPQPPTQPTPVPPAQPPPPPPPPPPVDTDTKDPVATRPVPPPADTATTAVTTPTKPAVVTPATTATPQAPPPNHTTKDTNPPAPTLPSKAATTTTPSTTGRGNVAAPLATTSGTPPPTTTSGVSTPVVIGGVIAAVIGIAGIIFAVMYYKRRRRNNDDGTEDFAPDAFKRQSVMLPDSPPPHGGGMMRQNNTEQYPASFANGRAHPFSSASYQDSPMSPQFSNGAYYGYEAQQGQASFNPGQVVPMAHPMAMNNSPPQHAYQNAANPFFSPVGESPMMSPVTPHTAPMNPAQAEQAALMRKSSATMATMATMNTGYVTRGHPSVGPHEYGRNEHEYVDLSRSSVTPFQAAQYAEISRRLNTAPPVPLPSPAIASAAAAGAPVPVMTTNTPPLDVGQNVAVGHLVARTEESLPESPFADPEHTRTSAADPDQQLQPPSPSHSPTTRINSIPPMLPEIHLPQRAFSPMGYPESNKQLAGARTGPSPLANVAVPSNAHLVDRHSAFADVPKTPNMDSPPITPRPHVTETKRPETLYDDDDAYAGI